MDARLALRTPTSTDGRFFIDEHVGKITPKCPKIAPRTLQNSLEDDQNGAWECFENDLGNRSVPGIPKINLFNMVFID